ncbi:MAG: hypothetical protein AB1898_08380 [Acidobacteriota bacterium]
MIELNQPIQCLFCPQRRKIALLLKVVLAASAGTIVGLILFLPRVEDSAHRPPTAGGPARSGVLAGPVDSESAASFPSDGTGVETEEFQKVQSQLKAFLGHTPANVSEARKLIESRKQQLMLQKVLALGGESFQEGKSFSPGQKRLVLRDLEYELGILSRQLELLDQVAKE